MLFAADPPGPPRYAGFWIRVAANVLDLSWIAAANAAVALAASTHAFVAGDGVGSISVGLDETALVFGVILPPVVTIAFWIVLGATPGKWLFGIRIVDEPSGRRARPGQCIARYFLALVAIAFAGIGYVWIAIDPRKQGWHDKIVRTVVVHRGAA